METGFLNKHDEYFSSDVTYEQSNGFESEGSLFNSFVNDTFNNEFDEYQWVMNDEENVNDSSFNGIPTETPVHQDDFNKSFNDWQQHISNLKREDDFNSSNLFLQEERIADIFPSCSPRQLSTPTLPSLLDDPLNPDLLLEGLSDSPTSPDPQPPTAPPETIQLWGIKPSGRDLSLRLSRIKIKPEPKDTGYSPAPSPSPAKVKRESLDCPCDEPSFSKPSFSDPEPNPVISCLPFTSTDLGPDNYDVVDIKVEGEEEEEDEFEVDIETVSDSMPVIMASDMSSLLDQFEATEKFNSMCKNKAKEAKAERWISVEAPMTPKVPPLIIKKTNSLLKVEQAPSPRALPSPKASPRLLPSPKASPRPLPSPKASPRPFPSPQTSSSPCASPFSAPRNGPVNKTIIDSFPHEVIERIKKSSSKKKKIVPVVPAEPLPAKGNSHMKDAGASKSKMRDLVNKKKAKTESAQAQKDHDYCTNENKPSSEALKVDCLVNAKVVPPAKPPVTVVVDAFSVTEEDKWVLDNEQKLMTSLPTASPSPSEASSNARNNWEKNSKRDSGLESGDVSDASESPSDKKCPQKVEPVTDFNEVQMLIEKEDCPNTPETLSETHTEVPNQLLSNDPAYDLEKEQETRKKKLNLDEYRTRRKFARLSSPVKSGTIGEAILSNKWVQRPSKDSEPKPIVEKNARVATPEVRMELSPRKPFEDKQQRDSRSRERTKSRYRHRSSSSSSLESRTRSSRVRERSRDRRRTSHRSRSRTRSAWSHSRSRSSTSDSSSSSSSRSRSRSESRNRSRSRSRCSKRYRGRSRSRSRSSYRRRTPRRRYSHNRFSSDRVAPYRPDEWNTVERLKQVEERRVIYVGKIEEGTTKSQLREMFQKFGPILDISLHFRERGDNYGFVTFSYKGDAYKAVEESNDLKHKSKYEVCFGGRRAFCKQRYADLDDVQPQATYSPYHQSRSNESFDSLLRAAREKLLRNAKAV